MIEITKFYVEDVTLLTSECIKCWNLGLFKKLLEIIIYQKKINFKVLCRCLKKKTQ